MSPNKAIKILIVLALVIIISLAVIYKIRKDFNITNFGGQSGPIKITSEEKEEPKVEIKKTKEELEIVEKERREDAGKKIQEDIKKLTEKDNENGGQMSDETARSIEEMIKEEMKKRGQLE